MYDRQKLNASLEEQIDELMKSKNPDDLKVATALIRLKHNLKSGKYDVKVWED
ncbi:hypothetical protein [Priestia aryabhattai]|uniref:hypothetical protein n=1 Tax=Priestia aryabhattai TaxID=412384 RepID=UPI0015F641EB|nr:hypothetical protein [Priestia aryabhattai]